MNKYLVAGCSVLAFASAARAEVRPVPVLDDPAGITVLATGSSAPVDQTGQAVAVFSQAEIDARQGPDLTRLLELAPGVSLARTGPLGAQTSLFVRGAGSEQVLVLLDGVRLTDQAAPSGGTDLGTLSLGALGKVELLRGSNSVIWGSDAIGGVLALTSRETSGLTARAEGGSFGTFNADASAGYVTDSAALSVTGGYTHTNGISAAATGTEPDGFEQWRVAGTGHVDLAEGLSVVATARYARGTIDIDGFPAPAFSFADTAEYQITRQASGRAGLRYRSTMLDLDAGFALSDTRRANFDPAFGTAPGFSSTGRSERADLTGRLRLPSDFALDFGADSEWTRYNTLFDPGRSARLTSGHALLGYYGTRAQLAAGVRVDDHNRFGTVATFGANGSVMLVERLRLTASYGEGFKAPTLFQLYSDFGNDSLRAERSRSFEAGLAFAEKSAPISASITAFRRDTRNLIDFVSCFGVTGGICTNRPFGTYDNVSRARAQGVEVQATVRPVATLQFGVAFTALEAKNRTAGSANAGKDLARRPNTLLTVSADWETPLAGLSLGADLRVVSDSFENASNRTRLDGYQLVTLRADLPLTDRFRLFGRVENLFNERYQTAAGYGTYGTAGYGGIRVTY